MGGRRWTQAASRAWELARIAWAARRVKSAGNDAEREEATRQLVQQLAQARGLAMKVGQLAAGMQPPRELEALVHGIPARPLKELLPQLEAGLGRSASELFEALEEPAIAASLGQVHRGRLRDGTQVAVKLKYPDIDAAVDAELSLSSLIPTAGPLRTFEFELEAYRQRLRENLVRELDYASEATRQLRFHRELSVPGLIVPRVFPELCAANVLVQAWEDGVRLEVARTWESPERMRLGRTLLQTLFKSFFVLGEVHGDPHPGNLLFRRGGSGRPGASGRPEVVLLDFGCTVAISQAQRLALLQLLLALRAGAPVDLLSSLAAMGFQADKLRPIEELLPGLVRLLFEPFLLDRPLRPAQWQVAERLSALLGDLKWWFRSAGQPQFVLLVRAFQGLVAQLEALDCALPWWPLLAQTVGPELLAEAEAFPLPRVAEGARTESSAAKRLKVEVRAREGEREREVLSLAMPAGEALHLEAVIPAEVLERLRASGLDLTELSRRLERSGLVPQEVFRETLGPRTYHVWLE